MGHCVQLVIGRGAAVEAFLHDWPVARAVQLDGEWRAIPVDEALYDAIAAGAPNAHRDPAFDSSAPGLEAALARASTDGALAYIETDYHGGTGDQSAGAWIKGRSRGAERGHGSINSALIAIGVLPVDGKDAFDTIRLGERRHMEDYEPEGPRRLRPAPAAAEVPSAPSLPIWLVALVFAGAIAVGVLVALL